MVPTIYQMRRSLAATLLCGAASLLSCTSSSNLPITTASALPSQWVVAWGAPPENALATAEDPGGSEQSFRFFLLPTIDGSMERVHLSNLFGASPITVGAARIAVAAASAPSIDTTRDAALTFNGSTSVTLQAGQEIVSDPVNLTFKFGEKLAVSVYLKGAFPPLTQHDSQVTLNYASATGAGDTTTDSTGGTFANGVTEWFLLTGVDVYGAYQGTVAYFGSSSVDGHNSSFGSGNLYPVPNVPDASLDHDRPTDWLARDLIAAGYRMGVLNAGTLGNPAGEDSRSASGSTVAGVDRFNHDVLRQPGIKAVVIYTGGIDLRSDCVSAASVEASLSSMAAQAYAANVRVILGTIPPSEYCLSSSPNLLPSAANPYQGDLYPGPENPGSTQRRAVNDWIRTTGLQLPGVVAIADFDAALRFPAHPDFFLPNIYSNDNFHPNAAGYGIQSAAVPLQALLGP